MREEFSPLPRASHVVYDLSGKFFIFLDRIRFIHDTVMFVGMETDTSETIRDIIDARRIDDITGIDNIQDKTTSKIGDPGTAKFIRIIYLTTDAVHTVFHPLSSCDMSAIF